MIQDYDGAEPIGGGESTDEKYLTWEQKVCLVCGRTVKETYICEVIKNDD